MNIAIISVGKLKEEFYRKAVNEYLKRLQAYVKLENIEIEDESEPKHVSEKNIKIILNVEAKKINSNLKDNDYIIPLCIDGKQCSSIEFADIFKEIETTAYKRIVFIIGGSNGIDLQILNNVHRKISFSKMTFPHQLARVVLVEQIYRAYKIINCEKYHK